jgi:hypothetical protein
MYVKCCMWPALALTGLWRCNLQALAAENVSLENQLLEAKSSQLRHEKQAAAAAAATAKLEAQLAKLTQHGDESSAELAALTSERRILKARLMQAEARMRAAGLQPLPPLPSKGTSFVCCVMGTFVRGGYFCQGGMGEAVLSSRGYGWGCALAKGVWVRLCF